MECGLARVVREETQIIPSPRGADWEARKAGDGPGRLDHLAKSVYWHVNLNAARALPVCLRPPFPTENDNSTWGRLGVHKEWERSY